MVAFMAKKTTTKPSSSGRRAEGAKDVFARLDGEVVDKLDAIAGALQPRTTRSAVIAHLIEQYVAVEWPKHASRPN